MKRPTWDEYFMELAEVVAKRSACLRRQVGAVIVKRNHAILATGYNGTPPGVPPCETCMRQEQNIPSGTRQELCRALHAEQNALLFAENRDALQKATMYVTFKPCSVCAKMVEVSGIRRVVYPTLKGIDQELYVR
jgi:dCMP deaminase